MQQGSEHMFAFPSIGSSTLKLSVRKVTRSGLSGEEGIVRP
jgi:hypothetical protein